MRSGRAKPRAAHKKKSRKPSARIEARAKPQTKRAKSKAAKSSTPKSLKSPKSRQRKTATRKPKLTKVYETQFTIEIMPDSGAVAEYGAQFIANLARETLSTQKNFTLALSGGKTPWPMFRRLAAEELPWKKIHLFQTDERVLPKNHSERNLTQLQEIFAGAAPRLHPMPVEANDPERACASYTKELQRCAGRPAVLDLIHLGLGEDGHTASLFPGDDLLDETKRDVALSDAAMQPRRMTLTLPAINRAKQALWVITGKEKSVAFQKLLRGDPSIPASRIACAKIFLLVDEDAASLLPI